MGAGFGLNHFVFPFFDFITFGYGKTISSDLYNIPCIGGVAVFCPKRSGCRIPISDLAVLSNDTFGFSVTNYSAFFSIYEFADCYIISAMSSRHFL